MEAKFRAEESAKAADELAKAEKAAEEVLAVLEAEQKAFDDKCAELEALGNDESKGVVKRNKAKNELAQMKSTDPLPLNRAKINQGVRKLKKAKEAGGCGRGCSCCRKAADEAAIG